MKISILVKTTDNGNFLTPFIKKIFLYSVCSMFLASILLIPLSFNLTDHSFGIKPAMAKSGGNGGGKGGGNGGGKGGGKSGGDSHGNGLGHDKGTGFGHSKGQNDSNNQDATTSDLGRLNAAHASPVARDKAAPNSAVGRVAAYEKAALAFQEAHSKAQANPDDQDLQDAARAAHQAAVDALNQAANKSTDHAVAKSVNDILGINFEDGGPK